MEFAIAAFIAGLFTFLAPCTLPLVPGYLGFISGTSVEDLKNPLKAKRARWNILINGLFFITGFSVVFIIFGTLAGFFGAALVSYRLWLTRIGGIFVIIFGLFMLNVIKIPFLAKERHVRVPSIFKRGKPHNSFILGSTFGFGWTPCVGPVLGSILALAASSATVAKGAFLLSVFSLGLAVPFLIIAVGYGSAAQRIENITRYLKPISVVGGIFLILIGLLLLTDRFVLLISYGFGVLRFLGLGMLEETRSEEHASELQS